MPNVGTGWIGSHDALMNYLRVVGADQDGEGKFLVRGTIVSFMGVGEEYTVGADAEYRVGGRWCNLASGLNSTSAKLEVTVI